MTVTQNTPDPASNIDPDSIVVVEDVAPPPEESAPQQPPSGRQARSGNVGQVFNAEEVERIRQEERARYGTLSAQLDDLNKEVAKYRQSDEERTKAEEKARKDAEKAEKKKQEEEMELRDLIARKDEEWEAKLATERAERERALALVEQERRHASLQNYLAQRMMQDGELIAPQLRQLVGGNTEEEVDAKVNELIEISRSILGDTQQMIAQTNAARPTVGVTAPPIGPSDMAAATRTYTPDDIKALTPEEYADQRESLLRAASASRRQ
jgi:TolA-binding protein